MIHRTKNCDCQEYRTSPLESLRRMVKMLQGDALEGEWHRPRLPKADLAHQRVTEQLGMSLPLIRSGILVPPEATLRARVRVSDFKRWSISCTLFDVVDRAMTAPPRVHISTPWEHIILAIGPHGRVANGPGDRQHLWGHVNRRPLMTCGKVTEVTYIILDGQEFLSGFKVCPLKHHDGPCLRWHLDAPQEVEHEYAATPAFVHNEKLEARYLKERADDHRPS